MMEYDTTVNSITHSRIVKHTEEEKKVMIYELNELKEMLPYQEVKVCHAI